MVATVSPAAGSVEETLSTLRYAQQARAIVNVARVNEDGSAALLRGGCSAAPPPAPPPRVRLAGRSCSRQCGLGTLKIFSKPVYDGSSSCIDGGTAGKGASSRGETARRGAAHGGRARGGGPRAGATEDERGEVAPTLGRVPVARRAAPRFPLGPFPVAAVTASGSVRGPRLFCGRGGRPWQARGPAESGSSSCSHCRALAVGTAPEHALSVSPVLTHPQS